jgi:hypothetical protein
LAQEVKNIKVWTRQCTTFQTHSNIKGAVSRRWLAKINGAKKRLKLMLHDWKRCSSLQFLKQSKDVLHNEGIINGISYFTPNLINCWQTVFQVGTYFGCAVEPWHCPFKYWTSSHANYMFVCIHHKSPFHWNTLFGQSKCPK